MPRVTDPEPRGTAHLAWVGTSFRQVGFERLGDLVLPPEDAAGRAALRDALGAEELVWLATCNRVECHLVHPAPDPERLRGALSAFFAARGAKVAPEGLQSGVGGDALRHLFRVTCALESLVTGETEIAGQVRRACERASAEGRLGTLLGRAMERAQACWRRVRSETDMGLLSTSVADLALEKVKKHFGPAGPRVSLIVGVGPMSRKAAVALSRPSGARGELVFANRTRARAEALATRFGGRAISLDELHDAPLTWVDMVFTATSASEPVLRPADLAPALEARHAAGEERPLIVCDLGIPRDTDPQLERTPGALVVTMEHIEWLVSLNRARHEGELARAEAMVAEELARWEREERFTQLANQSAWQMLHSRLKHLSADDQEAIARFATGLAARMARQPGQGSARLPVQPGPREQEQEAT